MEHPEKHSLAIDIGNTRTKIAWFQGTTRNRLWTIATSHLEEELRKVVKELNPALNLQVGWISVSLKQEIAHFPCWTHFQVLPAFLSIDSVDQLHVQHVYETPETLGTDRIVGIIAAQALAPGDPVLVIDVGTAITYDFADRDGVYRGGGISPGIHMRFQALHHFTARLPMVEPEENIPLTGNTTHRSIRSGVIHGAIAEVEGMIEQYYLMAGDRLKVFLTGGDILTFENRLKKVNFADPYLLLSGIRLILNQISTS